VFLWGDLVLPFQYAQVIIFGIGKSLWALLGSSILTCLLENAMRINSSPEWFLREHGRHLVVTCKLTYARVTVHPSPLQKAFIIIRNNYSLVQFWVWENRGLVLCVCIIMPSLFKWERVDDTEGEKKYDGKKFLRGSFVTQESQLSEKRRSSEFMYMICVPFFFYGHQWDFKSPVCSGLYRKVSRDNKYVDNVRTLLSISGEIETIQGRSW